MTKTITGTENDEPVFYTGKEFKVLILKNGKVLQVSCLADKEIIVDKVGTNLIQLKVKEE